jgi:hypothetical protein
MPIWLADFLTWLGRLSEFWAAIAGAIVGGVFSMGLQLIATRSARAERKAERDQYLKTLGYGVLWKTIHIHSDLHNISQHIEDSFRNVPEAHHQSPSQFVIQLASYPELIAFSTEEMALVVSLKSDDLLNDMMVISKNHRTVIDSIRQYDQLRSELGALIEPTFVEGMRAVVEDPEQLKRHHLKIEVLDDLIRNVRSLSEAYTAGAKATLILLHKKLKDELKMSGDLKFGFDPGVATIGRPS